MKNKQKTAVVTAALMLMTTPVFAHHSGIHIVDAAGGFLHPLMGVDHLVAMLAVGFWAALRPSKTAWYGPAAFIGMVFLGMMLSLNGLVMPMIEVGILASVVLLGLMVLFGNTVSVGIGLLAISGFALFHGQAHGMEATGSGLSFMAGTLVMTAFLHFVGYGLGRHLHQLKYGTWITGSLVTAGGLAMMTT